MKVNPWVKQCVDYALANIPGADPRPTPMTVHLFTQHCMEQLFEAERDAQLEPGGEEALAMLMLFSLETFKLPWREE